MYPMNYPQVPNYSPTFNSNFNSSTNQSQLIRVNGIDSAKAYPTAPNSTVALFDANEDIMYIKSTDASNFPTIRIFRFVEEQETQIPVQQYVTIEEFNKLKEEILNGKQFISNIGKSTSEQDKRDGSRKIALDR